MEQNEQNQLDFSRFLDAEGRIVSLPKKRPLRAAVLGYLAGKFEVGRDYTEREVTAIVDRWHTFGDLCLLRREMIEAGVMRRVRDVSRYWREQEPDADR